MENKSIIAVIVIAIILIAGFLYTSSSATVSAQGSSVLKVSPNKVSVYLYIEAKNKTAQAAKDAHDKLLDETILQLLKIGIERKNIKTLNFNIYPEYDWENGRNEQIGYIARQDIIVESTDFDIVASIVDAAINAGALVSSINFELSEEKQNEYKAQALEEASKDAKKKAEATAKGLDKNIGKLISVQGEEFNYGPIVYYRADAAAGGSVAEAKQAALNLAPTDIEVRASVKVEYKLRSF